MLMPTTFLAFSMAQYGLNRWADTFLFLSIWLKCFESAATHGFRPTAMQNHPRRQVYTIFYKFYKNSEPHFCYKLSRIKNNEPKILRRKKRYMWRKKNRKLISRTKERKNKLSQEMNSFFLKQENIVVISLLLIQLIFFKRYFVKFKNRKLIVTKLRFWKEYVCLFVCLFV